VARSHRNGSSLASGRCFAATTKIGSIELGKQADLAVWRLSGLAHADIVDPVAALVLGDRPPLDLLSVADRSVSMPIGC
jgi:cytosine/adenosine deaminase-related metal-dependent hydrolase